jgi:hypothetical protein
MLREQNRGVAGVGRGTLFFVSIMESITDSRRSQKGSPERDPLTPGVLRARAQLRLERQLPKFKDGN